MYYDNLDTNDQQRAIEEEREVRYYDDHYLEDSKEYYTEILETMGFSDVTIRYSGFGSQGDGLSFTGKYQNAKRITLEVAKLTNNKDILILTRRLMELQQSNRYKLIGNIESHNRWGNYVHWNTVDITTSREDWGDIDFVTYDFEWQENEEFTEIVQGLSQTFYAMLNDEYNSYVSDDGIIEYFRECGIEFERSERMVRA